MTDLTDKVKEGMLKQAYRKFATSMMNGRVSMDVRMQIQSLMDDKFLDDYMAICQVDDRSKIDWSNPHVALMHLLNDPLNNHIIMHGSALQKQSVYEQMTPEMLDIYWNYTDEHGARYCDKEDAKARKRDKRMYKKSN